MLLFFLDIVTCHGCGRAKRAHHLCPYCYSEISRGFKTAARAQARPTISNSSKGAVDNERSLGDSRWAKERGGAIPRKIGQPLTKWMRARAGFTKSDPKVRLGSERKVIPSKPGRTQDERHRGVMSNSR